MNGASTSLAIHTQRAFPERSEAGKNFPFCGKNFHGTAPQTGEENTRDGYELGDLDTRYHDMLRELRRWGITESDEAQRQEAVERAFKEPSNVIQIGDHLPEKANYAAVQDAVADAMEERS